MLLKLFGPKEAEVLRRTGQILYDLALQGDPPDVTDEEEPTRQELRAALTDLKFLRDYLLDLGQKAARTEVDLEGAKLCVLAAECGQGVGRIADAITEGLEG